MSIVNGQLVVGTMCHCDDPDECDNHWELWVDPVMSDWNEGFVARGRHPNEAELRAIAAFVNNNNSHSGVETISCAEGHHANCSGTVMNDEEPPCSCTCHQANYRTMIKSIARYNDSKYGLIFEVPYQEDDLLGKEVFIDDELYRVTGVNRMGRMPLGLVVVPVADRFQ